MPEKLKYILCAPWSTQSVIPCVKVQCSICKKDLKMAMNNVPLLADKHLNPLCEDCAAKRGKGIIEVRGGAVGGKIIEDPEEAMKKSTRINTGIEFQAVSLS